MATDLEAVRGLAQLRSVDGQVAGPGVLILNKFVLTMAEPLLRIGGPDAAVLVDLAGAPDAVPSRVAPDRWYRAGDAALLELDEPQPDRLNAKLGYLRQAMTRTVRVLGFPDGTEVWATATVAGRGELRQLASDQLTSDFDGGLVLDDRTGEFLGFVTVRSASAWLLPTDTIVRDFYRIRPWVGTDSPNAAVARLLVRRLSLSPMSARVSYVSYDEPRLSTDVPTRRAAVSQRARFCGNCGSPVGRSYSGRPALDRGHCAQCGAPFDFTPPLVRGEVVADRYEVAAVLAHGGFGWVFLARDRASGDTVVLKSLPATEPRLLSMMDVPGVVRVLDVVPHKSTRHPDFLVMEYVPGPLLRDVMHELLPEQVAAYGIEILSIVARLHRRGVLHCDIKPDNLIQTGRRLTLIDLGAARLISDRTSPVIGTAGYQVSDEEITTHGLTVRADLHAVGQTLRRLMASNVTEPESLRRLINRALAPYEQRYATADEMRDQLAGVLRELLSERDHVPRPVPSTLFSAMSEPLDGGLGEIPGTDPTFACPPAAEVAAALPTVLDSADATLRADWHAAVDALAANDVARAEAAFDRCHSTVPGEIAPTVALAFCAELLGRGTAAFALYETVWRRDRDVACAAFGLARFGFPRADAVEVLDDVPEHSPCWVRARIAAVRVLTATPDTLGKALERIPTIGLDRVAEARLTAFVLDAVTRTSDDALPPELWSARTTSDRLVEVDRRLANHDQKGRLAVAVDQTQSGDTLTVTVWVTANRRARDVHFQVWTTRGTTLDTPAAGPLGDMKRGERKSIQLTLHTLADGTPPGEAIVADVEVSAGNPVVAAVPIVGTRVELPRPAPDSADPEHLVGGLIEDVATPHDTARTVEPADPPSVPHSSRMRAVLERRPDVRPVSYGQSVLARVRCDADVVVPGQRARVALSVWAGRPVAPLDEPVAVRVMLDSAPAEVSPVSRVTMLTDDRTMTPVDFDVVPEEVGPLPLVFRIYRDADSHLLLEIQAELPVEAAP